MKIFSIFIFVCIVLLTSCFAQNPPLNQDGPWNHQIHFATSKDGVNWEIESNPIMKEASVPDIIVLSGRGKAGAEGTFWVYTVDARRQKPYHEGLSRLVSKDGGKSWSEPEAVKVEGLNESDAVPVDPSVVQLEDGNLRLYFLAMKRNPGGSNNRFYSAISEDGVNFKVEDGVRFEAQQITDPEVIFANGEWLMFISHGQESWLARSKDGLSFTKDEKVKFSNGGVPGAMALADGRVRVFVCGRGGILSVIFNPKTDEVTEESGVRADRAADPSIYRRSDGTYAVILKKWMTTQNFQPNNNRAFQPKFMQMFDLDKDGRLSREELQKMQESFDKLDENKDGFLDMRELMGPPPPGQGNRPNQ